MKISTRNQLKGTVTSIKEGAINSEVTLSISSKDEIVSVSTNASVANLGLKAGKEVIALIKASNVIIGIDIKHISARNLLKGTVTSIVEGAINDEVTIGLLGGGSSITAIITKESVKNLGLAKGTEATAIIKASEVILATE
ncbi:MAG: TOBE domain-containing protein [Paludibacteraceae bacterium]|nr:TOBE domain-containing protein [Paludibacteraceae bacterium]